MVRCCCTSVVRILGTELLPASLSLADTIVLHPSMRGIVSGIGVLDIFVASAFSIRAPRGPARIQFLSCELAP